MTRSLGTDLSNEVTQHVLAPIFLCEFFFDSGTVRFWNGIGAITIDGVEYTGSGNLLSVSQVVETQDLQANGLQFILTGLPSGLVSLALSEEYSGRECRLHFACMYTSPVFVGEFTDEFTDEFTSEATGTLVGDKYTIFSGFMDVMEIQDSGETATITLSAENRLIELKKPKVSRYTPEEQKRRYPGDKGLDFIPQLQDKEITWGRATPSR